MQGLDLRTFPEPGHVLDGSGPADYLRSADLLDSAHPAVIAFARAAIGGAASPMRKAVKLYYAVRDRIYYDPYRLPSTREGFRASTVIEAGRGFCITKAGVMAACARAIGIPARVGYADVRNHMTTKRLQEMMGSDTFYFHGYADLWLGGRWVKTTPAFNIELTEKFRLKPLDWDGRSDSIYHPFDLTGQRHMEYLAYRGVYADVPYDLIIGAFQKYYPHLLQDAAKADTQKADFAADAAAEQA